MFRMEMDIRFRDIDMLGHVNSAVYATYLETARIKYFLSRFGRYEPTFVLRRAELDYLAPLYLGEIAVVEMWVGSIGESSWEFRYRITEKNSGRIAIEAKTIQVWIDPDKGSKVKIPEKVKEVLEADKAD
jgi:acyl-CoA thioester hydrolase